MSSWRRTGTYASAHDHGEQHDASAFVSNLSTLGTNAPTQRHVPGATLWTMQS